MVFAKVKFGVKKRKLWQDKANDTSHNVKLWWCSIAQYQRVTIWGKDV